MDYFDTILIGTGQATGTLVPALLEMGKRIVVIERERVGGTCLNFGCTPTKTLVASARVAHVVRRAPEFGISAEAAAVDFARVMERQNEIRNAGTASFEAYLRKETEFVRGDAAFVDAHTVRVDDRDYRAHTIYIHAGARASVPDVPGIDTVPFLDNKSILDLDELPEHLVILGGSYIALEFGQVFRRLGSRVTVLQRGPRIMSREDEEIATAAHRVLADEGIEIICGTTVRAVAGTSAGIAVTLEAHGETRIASGSHLLVAAGRVPNSDTLHLTAAGVETDSRGFIKVNEYLQTTVPHIYAIGDVNGLGAFTHTSVHDGQIVLGNLRGETWKTTDRIPVYGMFLDPPLGRVGMNEREARASGRNILVATRPMQRIARAREKDETQGLIKLFADADTREILGASILGVGGDEIINMIALWMSTGRPYTDLQRVVLVHPTVAELIPWILSDLKPLDTG